MKMPGKTHLFTRLMLKHTVALDYYARPFLYPSLGQGAPTETETIRQYALSDMYLDQSFAAINMSENEFVFRQRKVDPFMDPLAARLYHGFGVREIRV